MTPGTFTGPLALLDPAEWEALWLSLQVSAAATALVAGPGVALGWLLARRDFRGKLLVDTLVHLPLVLTPVVIGYLLLLLLGRSGPLAPLLDALGLEVAFTTLGAVVAAAVVALPLVVRSVRTAVELVDPGLEDAAAVLGAGPWRRFRMVTLPLAAPGVVAGLTLGFARSLGEFGATITLAGSIAGETRTLPLAIFQSTQVPGGDGAALRLTVVSVLLSAAALLASELVLRRLRRGAGGGRT
ncbi:MAG: molybdate ABC transporter permease subunit [Planctomycetota bacterium]|jgi:molybdate transport system permease protein